jgi:hypothetical protein
MSVRRGVTKAPGILVSCSSAADRRRCCVEVTQNGVRAIRPTMDVSRDAVLGSHERPRLGRPILLLTGVGHKISECATGD